MKTFSQEKPSRSRSKAPSLRFSPYAWAKLLFLRDAGPTEVGAFGISAENDLLLVQDVVVLDQTCTAVTVCFDDEAVADFFDDHVDLGLVPERFGRVWLHTHPGNFPEPSHVDEETFLRCFGTTDWSVMFILARGGQTYARLRFAAGPSGELELPVVVDYGCAFPAADFGEWQAEYEQCVFQQPLSNVELREEPRATQDSSRGPWEPLGWDDYLPLSEFSYD